MSIYYESKDGKLKLDLSATFKSLQDKYPQVSKLTKTDKPVTVEINGQKVELSAYNVKSRSSWGITPPTIPYLNFVSALRTAFGES